MIFWIFGVILEDFWRFCEEFWRNLFVEEQVEFTIHQCRLIESSIYLFFRYAEQSVKHLTVSISISDSSGRGSTRSGPGASTKSLQRSLESACSSTTSGFWRKCSTRDRGTGTMLHMNNFQDCNFKESLSLGTCDAKVLFKLIMF